MGNSNVIIEKIILIQCCNIINSQILNEFDFKGGNPIKINGQSIKRDVKLINNKPNVNMNIEYKTLSLEIESQNKDFKKSLKITPWGIEGSSKIVNYEEGCTTYFGYDLSINQVRKIFNNLCNYILLQNIIDFALPVNQNFENIYAYETEPNSESRIYNKYEGIFFKIHFDFLNHKYYLKDMGFGFGTYIKIDNTNIKENTIINIGDSFLVFSYQIYLNYENEKKIYNQKLLFLKICNGDGVFQPIVLGKDKELYTIGRSKDSDIIINDMTLSRINCFLYYKNGIWKIQDGNQKGDFSTNGTWIYASEDTEIFDNMMFKSNKFNFYCKFDNKFKAN